MDSPEARTSAMKSAASRKASSPTWNWFIFKYGWAALIESPARAGIFPSSPWIMAKFSFKLARRWRVTATVILAWPSFLKLLSARWMEPMRYVCWAEVFCGFHDVITLNSPVETLCTLSLVASSWSSSNFIFLASWTDSFNYYGSKQNALFGCWWVR